MRARTGALSALQKSTICPVWTYLRSHLLVLAATFAMNQVSGGAEKEVLILSKKGALDGGAPMLPQGVPATHPNLARVKL
eukprot:scaffold227945_cov27-Tisochrysis_lutea.AAC.1